MTPERWRQIKRLYEAGRERSGAEREAFLEEACQGDEELRREVESLLAQQEQAHSFLESPALDVAAAELAGEYGPSLVGKHLVGKQIGSYRVISLLGKGGMGEVYLAQDEKLDRKIALKFLPLELQQDETARRRFLREAKSAAALDHPFICHIHEIGETEGAAFIAMEYVAGERLDQRLAKGPLPLKEALERAVEIAEALEAAHKHHIVHRDLKPSNILLTPEGHAKVMDFGLAKRLPSEDGDRKPPTATLSQTGITLGTLPYMSPEQLRGEAVDARSDLFSFGVVLYEMLTGVHPFLKQEAVETGHAILTETPALLSEHLEHVPLLLEHTLSKLLAKAPERRYQHIGDVRLDLKDLSLEVESGPEPVRKPLTSPPRGRVHRRIISAAFIIAVALVAGWWFLRSAGESETMLREGGRVASFEQISSIAVLPFVNLMNDPDQEYFVEGMTDAIIADLSKISSLKVISRTSAMRFKGTMKSAPEIARELGADAIVEGSVLRAGNQVRITVQLIHGARDQHLWAENYVRDLADILGLQSEVARSIAGEIGAVVTPEEERRLGSTRQVDPHAYSLYLKGNHYILQLSEDAFRRAIELYQEAVEADPGYAPAYSGLALAYTALAGWHSSQPPRSVYRPAKEAAEQAVRLDPNLAESHIALARVHQLFEWDWVKADREFKRGIELNPGSTYARLLHANYLSAVGRFSESIEIGRQTLEIDPWSPLAYLELGFAHEAAGETEAALEHYRRGLEVDPDFALGHRLSAVLLAEKQLFQEASQHIERVVSSKSFQSPDGMGWVGYVYAKVGKRGEALAILDQLRARREKEYVSANALATVCLGLDQREEALEWLERAYQEGNFRMLGLKTSWYYNPLRSNPRFQDLLRRMNFPE